MPSDIADTLFATTPRTIVSMISGMILAYGVMFATFATNADLNQLKIAYNAHVEEAALWQIQRVLDDVSDKRWELQQRIENSPGDVSDIVERDRDLAKREREYLDQIHCLKTNGKHCLKTTDF